MVFVSIALARSLGIVENWCPASGLSSPVGGAVILALPSPRTSGDVPRDPFQDSNPMTWGL
ncbi:hypothetical protein KAS10_00630 [Candidatus Aerophobetes bacterium]|nr:hypothetical protein [Candidatus Aerophobetes bacterium]